MVVDRIGGGAPTQGRRSALAGSGKSGFYSGNYSYLHVLRWPGNKNRRKT
jgi:hypothetical protein